MKKVLVLSSFLALGAVASYGAVLSCNSLGTLAAINDATAQTNGTLGSCLVGDKIFSNFVYNPGSGDPGAADVSVSGVNLVATQTFGLQFTSNLQTAWVSNFTLSFNIAIDQTICQTLYNAGPNCYISGVQDQMQAGANGSSNTAAMNDTHTVGLSIALNALNTNNNTGQILGLNQLTMGNTLSGIASTAYPIAQFGTEVFQGTVPEPVSMSLTGLGLLGLGFFGRRRLKS